MVCLHPKFGLAQSKVGLAQPKFGMVQPKVGLAQPKFGMVQLKVGIAQWHGLCHLRLVLVDQNLPRIYPYINHFLYYSYVKTLLITFSLC